MRTHGWGGATPANDQEALDRILDAADEAIEARGANIRITEPVDALVEDIAFTLEWLPSDKNFQLVLAHDFGQVSAGIMAEYMLRILQSFMIDPAVRRVEERRSASIGGDGSRLCWIHRSPARSL
jgi:hypothetical protein